MGRIVEIMVGVSALAGIATFLGFRAMFRKALRGLGRKPGVKPGEPSKQIEERRANGT